MRPLILIAAPLLLALSMLQPGQGIGNQFGDSRIKKSERPVVNLPLALRQQNWTGYEGSCAWASAIMVLRWQGSYKTADWIRANRSNGANKFDIAATLANVKYAETYDQQDVGFLEWSVRTRRGCCVAISNASHMVCVVDMTDDRVGILDNNNPTVIQWRWRQEFLNDWFASKSWAFTPLGNPPPPLLY